jgi:hypothetical protein
MKSTPLSINGRFGGKYPLHRQGRNKKLSKKKSVTPAFNQDSCSAYFFDPEDGGDMFLRNVD